MDNPQDEGFARVDVETGQGKIQNAKDTREQKLGGPSRDNGEEIGVETRHAKSPKVLWHVRK